MELRTLHAQLAARVALALAIVALPVPLARAQTPAPVTLDLSSMIQYRVTLAGRVGDWANGPMNASVELGAPANAAHLHDGQYIGRNVENDGGDQPRE